MSNIKLLNIKVTKRDLENSAKIFKYDKLKSLPKDIIINNLNLEIKDGESIVLLGPTGCGKTTILKLIAGLIRPSEGKVYFNDNDYTFLSPNKRNVGMVFQNYALYPHLTSKVNIIFRLLLKKRPKPEIEERIKNISEMLNIDFSNFLYKIPKNLSLGEKQKVALGRCVIGNPDVLLFDEPLSSLDAHERATVRIALKKILNKFKITTVYVTHNQEEASIIGDRIAVMNEFGEIEQIGNFTELYFKPKSINVASFIGHPPMNIIKPEEINIFDTKSKFVGIHSENVIVNPETKKEGFYDTGIIIHIENLLSEKLLHIKIKNSIIIAKVKDSKVYKINQKVDVNIPLESLYFLEK